MKMNERMMAEVARVFAALAEVSRLRILQELMDGPRSVGELVELTGLKQGNVSRHLSLLHREGLVGRKKDGTFSIYHIEDPKIPELCRLMCARLTARYAVYSGELAE